MSTNTGEGGFDGDAGDASVTVDDFMGEVHTPSDSGTGEVGGETVPEAETLQISDTPPEAAPAGFADQLDTDTRSRLEGKGVDLSDPAAAVKSLAKMQADAEKSYQQTQNLVRQYEDAFANMGDLDPTAPPQGQQQQQAPDAGPIDQFQATLNQFQQATAAGDLTVEEGLPYLLGQMTETMKAEVERQVGQRTEQLQTEQIQPLHDAAWQDHWKREVASIKQTDPQGFNEHGGRARQILEGMLQENPQMRTNKDAMKIAFAMARQENHLSGLQQRRAQTLQGGGAGPAGAAAPNPADEIWKQMEEAMPPGGSGGF